MARAKGFILAMQLAPKNQPDERVAALFDPFYQVYAAAIDAQAQPVLLLLQLCPIWTR